MSESISIYIHIPFCVKKCAYCDFYSQTDLELISEYTHCLIQEIQTTPLKRTKAATLYFGGGTPSLLSLDQLGRILETVKGRFDLAVDAEITLEVNPATVDLKKLKSLRALGINRLSIGVQSFDDTKLSFLGRIHTSKQAICSIEDAKTAGFEKLTVDLMYGLPKETPRSWQIDMETAVKTGVDHLSCYMLTLEPGTPLHALYEQGQVSAMPSEDQIEMFKQTALFLSEQGYEQYEISSFSNGMENRSNHNSRYWAGSAYQGFGPAAHSYDKQTRFWNTASLKTYIDMVNKGLSPREEQEVLTPEQQMMEILLTQLRTSDGIDINRFEKQFGRSFKKLFKYQIKAVMDQGFADLSQGRFVLTLDGKARLDGIVQSFSDQI